MKMRLLFPVFFFTGFVFFHFSNFAQDLHFNLVAPSKDGAGYTIIDMAEDTQGYMWLATTSGLYKYDGYEYNFYRNDPLNNNSPAATKIDCVISDKAGYVWLAPSSTGIDRLDPATGIFTHFRHHDSDPGSLANDTVKAMMLDHEGTIWLGTFSGVEKFDSKTNKFIHYRNNTGDPSSLSCNLVFSIYEDKQGTIWVGTGNPFDLNVPKEGGLNKLNKKTGKFTRYMHDEKDPNSLIDNRIRAIFEDSRGHFWVGTAGDGLHTMDRTKGIFIRHLYDPSHPEKLSRPPVKNTISWTADHITFITEDNYGKIWIGTFQGGLNVYDPATQKVSFYGAAKNSIEKMGDTDFWLAFKTRDKTIWISSWENNLYKIKPYQTVLPHTRINKPVISFAEDDAHSLWITTLKGLIHKGSNGKEEQFLINKDSSSLLNQMIFIEKDSTKFWITTFGGLYLFDPVTKKFSAYHHQAGNTNSLICDTVFTVQKNTDNTLWVCTANGLDLLDIKTGTFTHFQNNINDTLSISNNNVFASYTDKNQNVWVCTSSGLNLLDKKTGHFKRYLQQNNITSIIEDGQGVLWASANTGLLKYNKEADSFLNFTDGPSALSSAALFWLTEDHEQNIWGSSAAGIMRLNKERNNFVLYGKNQGVNASPGLGIPYVRQNGEIVLGDSSGYFNFQPGLLQQNVSAPIVAINNFLLNNIPVQPSLSGILTAPLLQTKDIRLNHTQNTFSFEFANIDFNSAHEDTRLLYMLQNYDIAWRKAGEERTAYYFNLPPGKYIFKVKAFNAAGVAAEKDIAVIISPPWWNTWWAYTIFVLLFAGLVRAYIVYRSRKLQRENKALEEKVDQRTAQLNQSLQNLKATQVQLVQSEKMASLGELTAGIAHEIQNPLNFVNNFSEVNSELIVEMKEALTTGNSTEANKLADAINENEQKIIFHGKRADAIVKGMLQHSRSGNATKEPVDINRLADEYLRLAYHGLRAKDKSFNATVKTDYDNNIDNVNIIPQDIGRVILNLITNAFYAVTEKKSSFATGSADKYDPTISISTKKVDGKVEIKVADNGSGIPQKVLDKIFQPFFTTKPTGQGTGLGLSLAYDIVKAHGGEIKVDTKEKEGTAFTIILPLLKT